MLPPAYTGNATLDAIAQVSGAALPSRAVEWWLLIAFGFVFTCLRVYGRIHVSGVRGLGWDDYLACIAVVSDGQYTINLDRLLMVACLADLLWHLDHGHIPDLCPVLGHRQRLNAGGLARPTGPRSWVDGVSSEGGGVEIAAAVLDGIWNFTVGSESGFTVFLCESFDCMFVPIHVFPELCPGSSC